MKNMDAMTLAVVRRMIREGRKPQRDIVIAFLADEEAGGAQGAKFLAAKHPGLFDGCTEAISEVGGYSYQINPDLRLYLIETAQKGMAWMRLTAGPGRPRLDDQQGQRGHRLCAAVARIGTHRFPIR